MVPNTAPMIVMMNFIILLFSFLLTSRYIPTIGIAKKTKKIPGTINNKIFVPLLSLNILFTSFLEKICKNTVSYTTVSYKISNFKDLTSICLLSKTNRGVEPKFSFNFDNYR